VDAEHIGEEASRHVDAAIIAEAALMRPFAVVDETQLRPSVCKNSLKILVYYRRRC
jgi:hypothetical protein